MKPMAPVVLFLVFACCAPSVPKPLEPAFFWWETQLDLSQSERMLQDTLGCKKLYVKLFDIGRNAETGEIEPYSRTAIPDRALLAGLEIVPTVFITNEVFQDISEAKVGWLAGKIVESIGLETTFSQLLLDCDWTPSTREPFFLFLQKLRDQLPAGTTLSATIRLHQYKFPQKTGVPPVDRGMLMFYNTGDVDEEGARNSIFHPGDAMKYVDGAPENYPLPLDLAIPLFSWALVFREGELWKIVPGPLPIGEMRQSGKFDEHPMPEPFAAQLWEVREGTFLGGHYLRPGDRLRVSRIQPELLVKVASFAQKLDLADDATLAFFHLGIAESEHFTAQLLDSVCITVRK